MSLDRQSGKNIPTQARNTLARHGLDLNEAWIFSDEYLLLLPNFGPACLAWVRSHSASSNRVAVEHKEPRLVDRGQTQ